MAATVPGNRKDPQAERIALLPTASLHEAAGKIGALPSWLRPLSPDIGLCGRALTVRCPPGDNLFLHHAIYAAAPGEVLVVDANGQTAFGYWGDIMTLAAQVRGLAGLVITGGVRDTRQLIAMGWPTFSGEIAIRGTGKDPYGDGTIGEPITIGDIVIRRGDIIRGDADGLMLIPADRADSIVERAIARESEEDAIAERLRAGETTLSIYRLPALASRSDD